MPLNGSDRQRVMPVYLSVISDEACFGLVPEGVSYRSDYSYQKHICYLLVKGMLMLAPKRCTIRKFRLSQLILKIAYIVSGPIHIVSDEELAYLASGLV